MKLEKLIFTLIIIARRLRSYFHAHSITVLADQPLKDVLHHSDTSGRLTKWTIELAEFEIQFSPRSFIKAQILMDFIIECTIPDDLKMPESIQEDVVEESESSKLGSSWVIYVNGSSNAIRSGARLPLLGLEGFTTKYALRFSFPTTNNEAEYEALLTELRIAKELGVSKLKICTDSQLVARQLRAILDLLEETCETASVRMAAYRQKAARHYNSRIRGKEFKVGDLILHEPKSLSPQSMEN
ncbi:uncharacterized protein [Elaeis guineensis]|uniref:uncharacterized protein n=1 Tax=Elaeis guineensis var. tenera TaxID=51953 RepID=UPI003C6D9FB1